ncbi:Uncharacterised protein [Mycobacteroides abscessus subsp. abscessus]|nr:Uncharacterised protein [Mycobacteroides abscessus subsp. abscessus]SIG60257.1 Uncharacterised protein [Mycobacteroides abscessus subsp. abscessus]
MRLDMARPLRKQVLKNRIDRKHTDPARTRQPFTRRCIHGIRPIRAVDMPQGLCGVDDDGHPGRARQRQHLGGRLYGAAVAAHDGEMQQVDLLVPKKHLDPVDIGPAIPVDRQPHRGESKVVHDHQIRTEFPRQAGNYPPGIGGPSLQQCTQCVGRSGGELHVSLGHTRQLTDRGTPRLQNRCRRLLRDVSADLRLMLGVLGHRTKSLDTLARAGSRIEVYTQHRRTGVPPPVAQAHSFTASDSPKSSASSVHQCVCRRPAAASSRATPSRRNLQDTSVSIISPASKSTDKSRASMVIR